MRPGALAVAVTLVSAHAGCGGGGAATTTVRNPHGTVTVDRGATLVLAFPVNPGVGFEWLRGAPNPDAAVLRSRGSTTDAPDRPGAGGEIRYRFEAKGKGATAVGFIHSYRGTTTERRTVRVTVR